MIDNQNYPWYLQQVGAFKTLYDGFYNVATNITPLGIGDYFDIDNTPVYALFQLGPVFGLSGSPVYFDGLIYNVDNWANPELEGQKVWTGQVQDANQAVYRNLLKVRMYCYGRPFTLGLIKEAVDILMKGFQYSVSVTENYMNFTINISAPSAVLRILQEMRTYDPYFLGQLPGISYDFTYTATDAQTTNEEEAQ